VTQKREGGGVKTRETSFPERQEYCVQKMFGKKLRNNGQNVFYIHTNIVTKKRGEKTSETIFQKVTNSAFKNVGNKIVGK